MPGRLLRVGVVLRVIGGLCRVVKVVLWFGFNICIDSAGRSSRDLGSLGHMKPLGARLGVGVVVGAAVKREV